MDLVGSGAAPHADCWMALHIFSTRQRRGAFDFLGKVNSLSYNIGYSDVGGYVRCAKVNDHTPACSRRATSSFIVRDPR